MTPPYVDRYRILSLLGRGGMGEVHLAEDTSLERRVALKLLARSGAGALDGERTQRFLREARLASALSHPNIAQIFEIGDAGDVSFIAMEYIDGDTLHSRVAQGPLPPAEVIDIAVQLFDALEEAHNKGIVHRDLKCANVMLTPRGRVKVLDFGLAKRVDAESGATAPTCVNTAEGVIVGTLQYMSPEQARGLAVDARTDIFSAGVVLYELLTGRLPFSGASAADTLYRIVHVQPDSILHLNRLVPAGLERLVAKALEKDAERRYQNARDVLIDLRNLQRDGDGAPSRGPASKRTRKAVDSIAVLPLMSMSTDVDIDYLADGITESLINALSQIPKLKVLARSTVFRYKASTMDPQAIGHALGVRAVLTGRLQTIGGRVRTRVELVDTVDGSNMWGDQFQHATTDVLALEEKLVQAIIEQLRLRLTRDERTRLQKRHTESAGAYEACMRGRFQLAKRTTEGFAKATECFERAIAEDSRYALAYAGLADCYTLLTTARYVDTLAAAPVHDARKAAERAIALDGQLAEGHSALGFVRFRVDWDWSGAQASFERACELNPGHAPAHHRYALLLSALGRHDEALGEIRRACELDPLSLITRTAHGRVLHFARRYSEAVGHYRQALELDDTFLPAHFDLAMALADLGRYDEAISELEHHIDRGGRRSVMVGVLGSVLARAGHVDRARALLVELRQRHAEGLATSADPAYVLAALGELEEAMQLFEQACDTRAGLAVYFKVEPLLDPIRTHPRFASMLRRLRLE
jgi:serine/threonine protein kinase/tetratricopeptide (TPR) repeat protein